MAPVYSALRGTTPVRGFFLGGLFGWLIWFPSVWWLQLPLRDIANMSSAAATLFTLTGCFLMAFPYAVAGAVTSFWRERKSGATKAACDAAIFTSVITFLTPIFHGSVAHTQYLCPIILQILELGGAPLLLFFILWVNFLIAESVVVYRQTRKIPSLQLAIVAMILSSTFIFGAIRLHQFDAAMKSAPPEKWITIGSVQPNIPIPVGAERQPAPNAVSNNFFTALAQARELARQHPEIDLFAFPENPATFVFNQDSARRNALGDLIADTGKPALLNVDAIESANADASGGAQRYNVTVLIDTNRNLAGNYPKMKRVPFVEYIPGETKFPWLRRWFPKSLRVLEGDAPKVFEIRPGALVIPLICYEGTLSPLTRQFVKLDGNVMVNQVNDSWFLRTPASEIHLALTLFRAVEYRAPLVRVTNAGIGAHIQATGQIVPGSRTGLFTEAATAFPLYIPPRRSVYSHIGNWWMLTLSLLWLPHPKRNRAKYRKQT